MAQTQTAETTEQLTTDQQNAKQTVHAADLHEASSQQQSGSARSGIDLLLDVTLPVTVTLGKAELPIQQVLQLAPGSVLRLDRSIEAPVEMYVKNSKFAVGTVVVVNGKFGVRIKELFSVDGAGLAGDIEQQG